MTRTGGTWEGWVSPDGSLWRDFTSGSGTGPTAWAVGTAPTKLGIVACAGSATQPGGAWITEFRINRFTATGTFVSTVYDIGTTPVSLGPVAMTASFSGGAAIAFDFKSDDTTATFTDILNGWTTLTVTPAGGNNYTVTIPAARRKRYMQYRLRLSAPQLLAGTGIASVTPIVYDINIPYSITNPLGVTFDQRGWVDLLAQSTSPAASCSLPVEIKGGLVATIAITVPASTTAGAPLTLTVKAGDGAGGGFGNVADDATGTWRFTTSDGEPFSGTVPGDYTLVPAADKGQRTFYNSSVLRSGVYQTITVTDGTRTATSSPILVNPGPINSFLASATTPQPASTSFRLYMEALDQYLNRKTDYFGLMSFFDTHTGGTAAYLPSQLPAASWSAGLATLTPGISFTKAETVKVIVQGDNRTGTSNDIVIHGATATSLLLAVTTNQPEAGVPFGLTLTALDTFGNVAINYAGTVGFTCTDVASGVKVPATYTFTPADKGIRTWPASTTLMTPGPVNITAKDTVIASMTKSYPVTVLPGPAARFEITCSPIVTAGVPFNIVITAYDAYGNKKTNFTETVNLVTTFTSILPTSVSGFSNGELLVPSTELTHSGALPATGLITVTFGAGASGSIPITLYPPSSSFSRFDLEAIPASPTAGDAFKLVIKAVGPDGAVYTNYAGVGVYLDASNTSGLEVVPPMLPDSAAGFTIGVKEVYARIWEAGQITIWAHDQTIPGKVGSLTLTVLPTNLSYYTVVPGTSTVEPYPNPYYQVVNGSFPLYLSAFDAIGNLKTNYIGTVNITENGTGTLNATQATFVGGLATISQAVYNWPGKMQITINDPILDKSGTSSKIAFFGPIASVAISCGTTQTDEAAFLTQVTAFDTYGQVKLNALASLTSSVANWTLAPGVTMSLTPVSLNPVSWVDGIAYPILTANRGDAGADIGTLTFRLGATSTTTASGTATINVLRKALAGPFDHFLIETFSPQKASTNFPMLVKAVDVNNVVVSTFASATSLIATSTLGVNGGLTPAAIPGPSFTGGVFSTTNAQISLPGTYTVSAVSGTNTGSFFPLLILPGGLTSLKVNVPTYAPLNAPFTMSVSGMSDALVKTDYVPEGPMLLQLNATATGFLGVQYIDPSVFVDGVGTITVQTYNKSQLIWIKATDPTTPIASGIGGPISVFGAPAKLVVQPLPAATATFYWNAFFPIRITVKDANGFVVPTYDGTINFAVVPGTAPTATDPIIVSGFHSQYLSSAYEGVRDFPMKVDYSTPDPAVYLKFIASDPLLLITGQSGDILFRKDHIFDHYEIVSPAVNATQRKIAPFSFRVRAIDNFGLPLVLTASYPQLMIFPVIPTSLTNFVSSPSSPLEFLGTAEITTTARVDYDESCTSTVRINVTPETPFVIGSATRDVPIVLEDPRVRTDLITVSSNTRYILSLFARTGPNPLNPIPTDVGTGVVEVAEYSVASGPFMATGFALLHAPDGTSNSIARTNGKHNWRRYWWWFETAPDTASIAIRLSADYGVVYFDAVQLEKALINGQEAPTAFTPHRVNVAHPASHTASELSGEEAYWQW